MATVAVNNGGWEVQGCSATAQAEAGMSRATAWQRHWWLSRTGRYGASRDDGGSDQGSVIVHTGCGRNWGAGKGSGDSATTPAETGGALVTAAAEAGTQGYDKSWERQGDMK